MLSANIQGCLSLANNTKQAPCVSLSHNERACLIGLLHMSGARRLSLRSGAAATAADK
jgi:hypothetical protein